MKIKLLILIGITSFMTLHSVEDKNFIFASGLNITNHTFEHTKDDINLIYDLMFHIDISLGYNFKIPGSDYLSIRSDLSVIPFRAFSDFSISLAYSKNKHQFSIGPSIAFDSYFLLLRTFSILLTYSNEGYNQAYWVYSGLEAAYRYRYNENLGFYIKYKQSLFNLSSLFLDVLDDDLDRYNFVSAGISIYF